MTDWKLKDEQFKKILSKNNDPNNEEASVLKTKNELLPHLRTCPVWSRLPGGAIQAVATAKTFHSLNRAIDTLYDFADDNRIWLGFMD